MKQSFDKITNSWLYRIGAAIGNVVIISALFLLFCLPVVTIGASASVLYYTVYRKYTKKCDSITSDFMRSLKQNLKSGIIINVCINNNLSVSILDSYMFNFAIRIIRNIYC